MKLIVNAKCGYICAAVFIASGLRGLRAAQ